MAKLKAPLLSLGASGALGKAIVFFPWKGLDCAREYVIPANPKTTPQTTQRDYLKDAVTNIHYCQGRDPNPLDEDDISAYSLLGSIYPTPRTWFNSICKQHLDSRVAGKNCAIFTNGECLGGAEKVTVTMWPYDALDGLVSGKLYYGKSKTALNQYVDCSTVDLVAGKEITTLAKGTKYFVQFRATTPDTFIGANSGIYHGTTDAA